MTRTEEIDVLLRPRICCIDLMPSDFSKVKSRKHNLFNGTLGNLVNVPNRSRGNAVYLLLDYDFPENFLEFDILIIDLTNESSKEFNVEDHLNKEARTKSTYQLVCRYPTTTFDPKPLSATILAQKIQQVHKRPFIQIVFACKNYSIEYESVQITNEYPNYLPIQKNFIYDFAPYLPLLNIVSGREVIICDEAMELTPILERYKRNISYEQTFFHPKDPKERTALNPNFVPLLRNINNEIVSFFWFEDNLTTLVLPNIENKGDLISDLLASELPTLVPVIFPFSTKFKWKEDQVYYLPNHLELINEKLTILKDKEIKLKENQEKINENNEKYQFLHDLLTETGDTLVKALHRYLMWLEFNDVKIQDEHKKGVLEEDLQVALEKGLLIIEAKGIGGTSTDSDCSQISKIKYRRSKERKTFDVFAVYIVNHQRHLPPLDRKNPPFTDHQITDAENDERGLLSTWQLFNLYFDIQSEIISKADARMNIMKYGLIEFRPKTKCKLAPPKQILKDGHVIILDLVNTKLKTGQVLVLEKNNRFFKTKIDSIQLDGEPIDAVENGEIGLKLNDKISKGTTIWTI